MSLPLHKPTVGRLGPRSIAPILLVKKWMDHHFVGVVMLDVMVAALRFIVNPALVPILQKGRDND
jgi:hypothetical protein